MFSRRRDHYTGSGFSCPSSAQVTQDKRQKSVQTVQKRPALFHQFRDSYHHDENRLHQAHNSIHVRREVTALLGRPSKHPRGDIDAATLASRVPVGMGLRASVIFTTKAGKASGHWRVLSDRRPSVASIRCARTRKLSQNGTNLVLAVTDGPRAHGGIEGRHRVSRRCSSWCAIEGRSEDARLLFFGRERAVKRIGR